MTYKSEQINDALEKLKEHGAAIFKMHGEKPEDEWDEPSEKPCGQTSSMKDSVAQYHAWLIVYPSPDNSTVLPMLLIPCEEGGPFLVPLDACSLASMSENYWIDPDGKIEKFLDRFKRLFICHEKGDDILLQGLRRTAPWLKKNPFMKMKKKHEKEMDALKDYYNKLSAE